MNISCISNVYLWDGSALRFYSFVVFFIVFFFICLQGYEGSLLKVTSKNGKTASVSVGKTTLYFNRKTVRAR